MRAREIDTRPDSIEKTFFDLSTGFVTELSPLGMPGGTTIAESNFEILRDGTRRRRKALREETGGAVYDFSDTLSDYPGSQTTFSAFRWLAPANDTSKVFIVTKLGGSLHFWSEGDTLSTEKLEGIVDLSTYSAYGTAGDASAYVANYDVTLASMHGRLFVAGKYIKPLYISYNVEDDEFEATTIDIRIRDLVGVEDGVALGDHPTTLTNSIVYNLVNRGWNETTYNKYYDGKLADGTTITSGRYPAKNQIWWKAMVRWADSGTYQDGLSDLHKLRTFDTAAIEQEVFGTTSAPQGHLFINPFDTSVASTGGVEDGEVEVKPLAEIEYVSKAASVAQPDGSYRTDLRFRITVDNTSPAWAAGDTVTLNHTIVKLRLLNNPPTPGRGDSRVTIDLSNAKYELSSINSAVPSATTFIIHYEYSGARFNASALSVLLEETISLGSASKGGFYEGDPETVYSTPLRPVAVATFAGRVWYAGCEFSKLADTIFFSQIGSSRDGGEKAYAKMYQEGDPSSEYLNIVQPSDGGTIQIPGLSGVKALVPLEAGILVLSEAGIWEISGGDAYFTATNIRVRKLADVEVLSPKGWALTDYGMFVASPRGIFTISPEESSGRLGIKSVTRETVQTYWQSIPHDNTHHIQLVYDNAMYRLYTFFTRLANKPHGFYSEALVLDLEKGSYYRLDFPVYTGNLGANGGTYIHGVTSINDVNSTVDSKKIKFFVVTIDPPADDPVTLSICDMDHTDFVDFDGNELVPYIETGYDGIGEANYRAQEAAQSAPDHSRKRFTPYVHVFMKRTETGVDPDTFEVQNQSSLFMQGRWDFTDDVASGKIGTSQQVYRPRSNNVTEIPMGAVVITKNVVRGTGRSLHLKFYGEEAKDAHLLGYAIEYKGARKA